MAGRKERWTRHFSLWPVTALDHEILRWCVMRRKLPDGSYEYRKMAPDEAEDQASRDAW